MTISNVECNPQEQLLPRWTMLQVQIRPKGPAFPDPNPTQTSLSLWFGSVGPLDTPSDHMAGRSGHLPGSPPTPPTPPGGRTTAPPPPPLRLEPDSRRSALSLSLALLSSVRLLFPRRSLVLCFVPRSVTFHQYCCVC